MIRRFINWLNEGRVEKRPDGLYVWTRHGPRKIVRAWVGIAGKPKEVKL